MSSQKNSFSSISTRSAPTIFPCCSPSLYCSLLLFLKFILLHLPPNSCPQLKTTQMHKAHRKPSPSCKPHKVAAQKEWPHKGRLLRPLSHGRCLSVSLKQIVYLFNLSPPCHPLCYFNTHSIPFYRLQQQSERFTAAPWPVTMLEAWI